MELGKTHFVPYQSPYRQCYCSKSLIGRRKSDAYVTFYFELDNRRRHSVNSVKQLLFQSETAFMQLILLRVKMI